jgi:hypothetical protein
MSRRGLAGIALLALAAGAPACDDDPCISEHLHLRAEGSCLGVAQDIELEAYGCRLTTSDANGLPRTGAAYDALARLRDGGWALYGEICPAGDPACATPAFRLCRARRVEWRLELACVDGAGAPVCQATLTE